MSQENPKDYSLERQAGCVHSDKHASSPMKEISPMNLARLSNLML